MEDDSSGVGLLEKSERAAVHLQSNLKSMMIHEFVDIEQSEIII